MQNEYLPVFRNKTRKTGIFKPLKGIPKRFAAVRGLPAGKEMQKSRKLRPYTV